MRFRFPVVVVGFTSLLALVFALYQADRLPSLFADKPVPRLEAVSCWFDEQPDLPEVECFQAYLPQSIRDGERAVIQIPVIKVTADANEVTRQPDPVIVLGAGGPGSPLGLGEHEFGPWVVSDFRAMSLARGRDLYLMDPRGVGQAVPELLCPELIEFWKLSLRRKLAATEIRDRMLAAMQPCGERYRVQGVDLRNFTNDAVAHDVATMFELFGISQWNLYGVSYGASYALSVLNRYPGFVRAMVLDSAAFSDPAVVLEDVVGTDRALELLFKECAEDETCRTQYPGLRETFDRVFERLNRTPLHVEASNPYTGDPLRVRVDGDLLAYAVVSAMYEHHYPDKFPPLIASLDAGDTGELVKQLEPFLAFTLYERFSDLVLYANHCSLMYFGVDYPQLAERYRATRYAKTGSDVLPATQAVCGYLNMPPSDPVEPSNLAPVPILFLQGGLDPVTPLESFLARIDAFQNYRYVLAPRLSHSLLSAGECYGEVAGHFLDNPMGEDSLVQMESCGEDLVERTEVRAPHQLARPGSSVGT